MRSRGVAVPGSAVTVRISDGLATESIERTTREALDSLVPARLIQESYMKWRPAPGLRLPDRESESAPEERERRRERERSEEPQWSREEREGEWEQQIKVGNQRAGETTARNERGSNGR